MQYREPVEMPTIANGAGDPVGLKGLFDRWIAVTGLTGGSAIVEWGFTEAGTFYPYVDENGNTKTFTANGQVIEVPFSAPFLRITTTSVTGPPQFWLFRAQP